MPRITQHGKERLVERNDSICNYQDAKRVAKIAWRSGKERGAFQKYPKFFSYLANKQSQSNTCSIRVYKGNIYIWRGKNRSLVTSHPIPDRYVEEMATIDKQEEEGRKNVICAGTSR